MSNNNSSSQQQQKNSKQQQQHNEAAEAAATQEKKQKQPFTNRLAHEKSPYLIQHQHNPVDWYPWGNEAFEKAKKEDKLIFLSVGYSTCHWCHVMQHESFENVQIAKLMNDYFVNIKVDREERPDVDRVYMTYVQATTGHGGWPMSVFLTSDLKPVFGGTYFPPFNHSTGGMMLGFATLLQRLHHLWQNDRKKLLDSANHVMEALKDAEVTEAITQFSSSSSSEAAEDNILKNSETMKMYNEQLLKHGDQYLEKCTKHLLHEFDHTHGGFGAAPKFPRPVIFNFLFHMYHRYHHQQEQQEQQQVQQQQQQQAENTTTTAAADIDMDDIDGDTRMSSQILHACLHTLNQMAHGGMYDTLGYGFHRYSVDAQWHVPHFEKMLYDQAQLVHAYLDATQVTCGTNAVTSSSTVNYINTITQEQSLYARIAHQVLKYVMRDLRDLKTGAFYSAEDADSIDPHNTREKREGAFYVWTFEELQKVLSNNSATSKSGHIFTPEQIAKFCNYYSCLEQGNVPDAQDAHGEFVNQNILHVNYDNPEQVNSKSGSSSSSSSTNTKSGTSTTVEPYFEEMKHHLLDYRNKTRVRPHLDDKVITSWNGIMIGAFARASRVLNIHQDMQIQQGDLLDKSHTGNASIYLQVAIDACEFLLKSVWDSNKRILYRASRNGEANTNIPGFLTDYACLISGLLDLYEASGNHKYAQLALEMQQAQDDIFLDKKLNYGATYYETSGNDSSILLRQKETYDGAEAAGNSITCMNLLRLSTLYDLDEYRNVAIRTLASFHKQISKIPYASPQLMCALDVLVGHQQKSDNSSNAVNAGYMKKVVLVTDGDQEESNTINALHLLSQVHEPNAVILHLNNKESRAYWTERLPYLKDLQMKDGKPTALLCMNKTCQLPTTDLPKVFSK